MKLEVIMPTAATDDDDDKHHQSFNNAKHDNDDATNINDHNESDTLPQTAKTMNSPSTSTASQKPIKSARRQSLRSYLQHVSLSDSIIPHSDTPQHSQENGGKAPPKVSGGNRRRRLEVMGLLQHLKINRYDNSSSSVTVDINNSSSVGSDDYNNGDDVGTCNTASRSGHQHGQRCLLHPTVRMRNDKCSLCCALAKTLEVRKAKKVVEDNATMATMEKEESVVGRDKDGPQGELDNHHLELIEEEQLQIIDAEEPDETVNKEDALSDDKLSTKRSDDASSSTSVAPITARRESEAPVTSINDKDDDDDDQVPQSTIDELDPQSAATLNKLSQRLLPNEKCGAATSSSSIITAMTVPATSATISKDDDNDNGGGDSDCASKDTSFPRPTTVALTKLQKTIALAKGALDSKPRHQIEENRQHSRMFSRNDLSAEAELNIVPLKDVSSPEKRSMSDVVVRRSSSYGSSASDESQSLPFQEVAVPVTATSSDASVRSTSDSSTLTSSTMGNNSLGSNSLGIHLGTTHLPSQAIDEGDDNNVSKSYQASKMGTAKRETTTVPSVTEGDVGDSSPSLDGEVSSGSACDVRPGEEDGEIAVSTFSHVVASGKSLSSSVAGSDSKNKAEIQSANAIVEDVYSDSDEEDKDKHAPSTKTVQLQSQTKASDTTTSNEEEGNDEVRIDSESGITSVTTPKRKHLEEEESSAKQSPSPTSVVEGPSSTSLPLEMVTNISHKVEGGTVDSTLASDEDSNTRRDSLHGNSNSSAAANSSNKHQNQFSEVERRLSRANQRLSRSTTRRENNNKRRSRSRSVESKIPFFAALVEHARSRSNSRTRQRSLSRSVTREGAENISRGEKMKLGTRQRSRSRSVKRNGGCKNKEETMVSDKSGSRSCSRSRSVTKKGGESESSSNKEPSRSRRSRSTASKGGKNISVEEKRSAGCNRSRSGSTEKRNLETNERVKVVLAKEEEDCSDEIASEHKSVKDEKALSSQEMSSSDPIKTLHIPNLQSMTVKALKAELNLFKVDYSSFNEKEQFIAAVRHSRETSQRTLSEITSMKLNALREELAMYDVDYSSFREKSEFIEALRNARKAELECVPQQTMVSPQEDVTEEPILKVDYREPITHPRYELGDSARDKDMMIFPKTSRSRSGRGRRRRGQDNSEASSGDEDQHRFNQNKVIASVKELHHLDAAFIRRSDGRWTYALVADGDDKGIRFVVNKQGATKVLTKEMWNRNVRRIKVLTQRKGDVLKVNDKPQRRRRDMRRSLSKRKGRLVSPSPTRNYRYRKLDVLSVPPTITEGKELLGMGSGSAPGLQRRRQYSQTQTEATDLQPEWAHLWLWKDI